MPATYILLIAAIVCVVGAILCAGLRSERGLRKSLGDQGFVFRHGLVGAVVPPATLFLIESVYEIFEIEPTPLEEIHGFRTIFLLIMGLGALAFVWRAIWYPDLEEHVSGANGDDDTDDTGPGTRR